MISHKKIFYINSRERISGNDSDFLYKLDITQDDDFDHACVLEAIIPKSYWLVESGYNTFQLEENGTTVTISVTVGNYNRKSFARTIESLLNSNSPNGWAYTISYPNMATSPDTGFYTYNVSGNSSIQPAFIFTTNVYEQFGFDKNSTNSFVGDTLTSTNVIKLQLEDTLFIHSDMVSNGGINNVLQHIFANGGSYSNIYFSVNGSVEAYSKSLKSSINNVYRFYLSDENGQPINLNGLNMVIVLLLYKKNTSIEDSLKLLAWQSLSHRDSAAVDYGQSPLADHK